MTEVVEAELADLGFGPEQIVVLGAASLDGVGSRLRVAAVRRRALERPLQVRDELARDWDRFSAFALGRALRLRTRDVGERIRHARHFIRMQEIGEALRDFPTRDLRCRIGERRCNKCSLPGPAARSTSSFWMTRPKDFLA